MNRPARPPCQRTYRQIQAHTAMRVSVRVGGALRSIVGPTGDISALPPASLQAKFAGDDYPVAVGLLETAARIKARYSRKNAEPID